MWQSIELGQERQLLSGGTKTQQNLESYQQPSGESPNALTTAHHAPTCFIQAWSTGRIYILILSFYSVGSEQLSGVPNVHICDVQFIPKQNEKWVLWCKYQVLEQKNKHHTLTFLKVNSLFEMYHFNTQMHGLIMFDWVVMNNSLVMSVPLS